MLVFLLPLNFLLKSVAYTNLNVEMFKWLDSRCTWVKQSIIIALCMTKVMISYVSLTKGKPTIQYHTQNLVMQCTDVCLHSKRETSISEKRKPQLTVSYCPNQSI